MIRHLAQLALLTSLIGSFFPLHAAAQTAQLSPTRIEYLNGGIGQAEVQQMKRVARDYSLALMFATRSGQYIADVDIHVKDSQGAAVLSVEGAGPMLLVKLPPGRYHVDATYNGTSKNVPVELRRGSRRELDLRWTAPDGTHRRDSVSAQTRRTANSD